jgi:hypothetical protein
MQPVMAERVPLAMLASVQDDREPDSSTATVWVRGLHRTFTYLGGQSRVHLGTHKISSISNRCSGFNAAQECGYPYYCLAGLE